MREVGSSCFGQAMQNNTLPRLNRVADETSRAARALGRTATGVNDNPQSLLYGGGAVAPGPGEAGFAAPQAKP